jgi:hypothetical protein
MIINSPPAVRPVNGPNFGEILTYGRVKVKSEIKFGYSLFFKLTYQKKEGGGWILEVTFYLNSFNILFSILIMLTILSNCVVMTLPAHKVPDKLEYGKSFIYLLFLRHNEISQ